MVKETFYRENGQIKWEINYKDGIDGKWTFIGKTGIEVERNYKDGKLIKKN